MVGVIGVFVNETIVEVETDSIGAIIQPKREEVIKMNTTISRYAIFKLYFILQCQTISAAVAVERAVARPPPAQIPACGITAPGSSEILASA